VTYVKVKDPYSGGWEDGYCYVKHPVTEENPPMFVREKADLDIRFTTHVKAESSDE